MCINHIYINKHYIYKFNGKLLDNLLANIRTIMVRLIYNWYAIYKLIHELIYTKWSNKKILWGLKTDTKIDMKKQRPNTTKIILQKKYNV